MEWFQPSLELDSLESNSTNSIILTILILVAITHLNEKWDTQTKENKNKSNIDLEFKCQRYELLQTIRHTLINN